MFIVLKILIIGAIIGACLFALASKQSRPCAATASEASYDPSANRSSDAKPFVHNAVVILRFIRNLFCLLLLLLIPFILFRFIL